MKNIKYKRSFKMPNRKELDLERHEQIKEINIKLDKILALIEAGQVIKEKPIKKGAKK